MGLELGMLGMMTGVDGVLMPSLVSLIVITSWLKIFYA